MLYESLAEWQNRINRIDVVLGLRDTDELTETEKIVLLETLENIQQADEKIETFSDKADAVNRAIEHVERIPSDVSTVLPAAARRLRTIEIEWSLEAHMAEAWFGKAERSLGIQQKDGETSPTSKGEDSRPLDGEEDR